MDVLKCPDNCKAECCGPVPLPVATLRRNQHKQQRPIIEELQISRGQVIPLTDDGRCVFLNDKFKCVIYRWRPPVCRLYGTIERLPCPYVDLDGSIRTDEEVKKVKKKIGDKIDMLATGLMPAGTAP